MFSDSERTPEDPERTHLNMGRTPHRPELGAEAGALEQGTAPVCVKSVFHFAFKGLVGRPAIDLQWFSVEISHKSLVRKFSRNPDIKILTPPCLHTFITEDSKEPRKDCVKKTARNNCSNL